MAAPLTFTAAGEQPVRDETAVLLSASDFAALIDEIDSLRRSATGDGVSQDATMSTEVDALMAELERAGVDRARLDQIATLIEHLNGALALSGGAGVGSIVQVADRAGRTSEYELIAQVDAGGPEKVVLGSPVARALLGARPGDYVQITLPNGRRRRVRVLTVQQRALKSLTASSTA